MDRESKRARKLCFTLMYKTCKDLEHHFEGIKLGDATAAYNRLTRVYNRQTTAGYIASSQAFTSSNMAIDHVDLCQFVAIISSRAKRVKSLDGTVSEKEKIAVLLGGLLPEFKTQKLLIQNQPIDTLTYEEVGNSLTDFAITEGIFSLKVGGKQAADKTYAVNANGATVGASKEGCRNYARDGTCSYGDDCKFSHSANGAELRKQRMGKGGKGGTGGKGGGSKASCAHCSKRAHHETE